MMAHVLGTSHTYFNPKVVSFEVLPAAGVLEFHRKLPFYTVTRLVEASVTAARLGVRHVWVKDESTRLGLPAYKILGASWATYRELETRFGPFQPWSNLDELKEQLKDIDVTLVSATDGNHGRAVARMAKWLGLKAHILVPDDMVHARREAIKEEGAQIEIVNGTYDDAVMKSAKIAGDKCLVISDTAWEGYEQVPAWIVEGYGTIFREIDEQLRTLGEEQPHLVAVQMGVGSLASSVIRHYRSSNHITTHVLGVEPTHAACVLRSLEADELKEVPGPHTSIMAGLNCGKTSTLAWPFLRNGLSGSVAIDDSFAEEAMRLLAQDGIVSGESGAAGLAGLLALLTDGNETDAIRQALGIDHNSSLLIISTEGATDPQAYHRIVNDLKQTINS
jgi:diaminopropionate ammonia-lyase